jgi:predicted GIY-YIG superfamily endonuclease
LHPYERDDQIKYFFVYVLRCCGNKENYFYAGQTGHLIKRLYQHLTGKGASFTKRNPPCELVHIEIYNNRDEALKAERKWFRFIKNKEFNFNLPEGFCEIFYKVYSVIYNPNPLLPLISEWNPCIQKRLDFIKLPVGYEDEDDW